MWKKKNAIWFVIFSFLLGTVSLYSKENIINDNQVKLNFFSYRIFPVNKPQFDYMSTLKVNSKSLGLKRGRELRRLLKQSNNFWAIRAVQRHILEKKDYAFQTNQTFVRNNKLGTAQAKFNFSLSPNFLKNFIEKRTTFSFGGLIGSNSAWHISSYFLQSNLNYINRWRTVGIFQFHKESHSFKINLGIEENLVPYFPFKESKIGKLLSGSLKFSDIWNISPGLSFAYEIKYDYLRWIKTFNLISPNIKFSGNLSDTMKFRSGFSYNLSAPGEINFIQDEIFSLRYYYIPGKLKTEKSFKCFFGFEKSIGKGLININAHYERFENRILPLPIFKKEDSSPPEFIYFIYNIGKVEDKGLNITFSKDIGSLVHGSISYGLIFSQTLNEDGKLITEPQILSSNLLENKVIHILSSIIEARIPITNTFVLANYNWSSDNLFYSSYSLNHLRSRIRLKQELPFLNFYGKIKIVLDLINFLENNDLLNNKECIILLPYSRKIIGGIEIKF